jgi:predicted permease
MLGNLLQDLRYALRQLRKSPGFTLTVVLMLALGIGANTAVFSVMNAVLMQWLPVSHPEGLTYVRMSNGQSQAPGGWNTGNPDSSFTEATFEALRRRSDVFEGLIGYAPLSTTGNVAVRAGGLPEEAEGEQVSGNFFSSLGAPIAAGRGFSLEEERNHAPIAILSYDYWTRRFSRNPAVIGSTFYVKGVPLTVVGVAGRGFKGIEPASSTDFWIPLQNRAELNAWGTPAEEQSLYGTPIWWCLRMMARLGPGVSPQQAQQALAGTFGEVVAQSHGKIDPRTWKPSLDFVPARGIAGLNEDLREPVRILMGLVALVLLIACINVVMMLAARNTVRQREFSLRMALGARRARVLRQLLAESMLLVSSGAALGWLFALVATRALAAWSEIETGLSPDHTVLVFTLAVSSVAALAFGIAPYWTAVEVPVSAVLRSSANQITGRGNRAHGARVVVGAQIAISLVLLLASGLLLRTLRNYATESLGVEAEGLLVFGLTPQGGVDTHLFYRTLLERIRQVPGVESVSMAENRPGSGWSNNDNLILDGVEQRGADLRWNGVGPGFFRTLGVAILSGRDIGEQDTQDSMRVAVVNQTLAERFFPHSNPIGHQIWKQHPATIVGVVADSKYRSVDEGPTPMAYTAEMQSATLGTMHIEVRTRGNAVDLLPALGSLIAEAYPNVPLEKPMSEQAQFEKSYEQQRMFAAMGGFFGVLAALLVATGLYGTHSFRVSQRTTEIGVRMALGASRRRVLAMVIGESLWVLMGGLAAGVPLTLMAARPLKSMLYQMSPFDPASFVLAIAVMIFVSLSAAWLPARRAASIEPIEALRSE